MLPLFSLMSLVKPGRKPRVNVGDVLRASAMESGMLLKQIASEMDIDEAQLGKALNPESGRSLDLWKLVETDPRFFFKFISNLVGAVTKAWAQEMWADVTGRERA